MKLKPVDVPVVILCGGLGTRLREETEVRPKPMIEIGHAPIVWHIMKGYGHAGFRRFILCAGYKSHVIRQFFQDFGYWGEDVTIDLGVEGAPSLKKTTFHREDWEITVAETGHDTMTGGRIKRIAHYIEGDVFMATYGDGLADINFADELRFHLEHGRIATLAAMNPRSRYGVVDCDEGGLVKRFREKPILDDWVNGGFYVFRREIFNYLSDDACVLEVEPLERLARESQLVAYPHRGYWETMDTLRDYQHLNKVWASGEAGWRVWKD